MLQFAFEDQIIQMQFKGAYGNNNSNTAKSSIVLFFESKSFALSVNQYMSQIASFCSTLILLLCFKFDMLNSDAPCLKNNVDPDQLASLVYKKPADQDPHCFPFRP